MQRKEVVIIKGAGDIASAVAHKLFRSGFNVVMTEIEKPTFLRRQVSFATCIYEGEWQVEGVRAVRGSNLQSILQILDSNCIAVLIDENCEIKKEFDNHIVIDGIIAKRNTGTKLNDAPLVIGLGPGFTVGIDVHVVVETNRGHNLGRILMEGQAEADTGEPGNINGYSKERVLRAPTNGVVTHYKRIGDLVAKDEVIAYINEAEVKAPITGIMRGLIQQGLLVSKGLKIGDIDPRGELCYVNTISDKGRCIAGGVLEAIMMWKTPTSLRKNNT